MSTILRKLKLVYLPVLLISIGFIAVYTFLNWLLIIKLQLFAVDEDIVNFFIPFAIPWLVVWLLIMPRIRLLNLQKKKGSLNGFYSFILSLAIIAPTLIAQSYLETATGKLTPLERISQINKPEKTKYYSLKNFYLDKSRAGYYNEWHTSGKHDEDLDMQRFIAVPVFDSNADSGKTYCSAWLGVKYSDEMSNRASKEEKDAKWDSFFKTSQADFDKKDLSQFVYLDRIGENSDHKGFLKAIKQDSVFNAQNSPVLVAVNEPFEDRNGSKFAWIFISFGIGAFIFLIMVLIPKFNEVQLDRLQSGQHLDMIDEEDKSFFKYMRPREGFFATPIIMALNILVFIAMAFAGLGFITFQSPDLLKWGADYKPLTENGEWWRLITNTFVHGGIMHLLGNMYGMLIVGIFLEPVLGSKRYAVAYLVTGIAASITSLVWNTSPIVSVGASGAIFGLYGVFLSLLLTRVFPPKFTKAMLIFSSLFVGINLVMGLAGGIDNAAHLGGLASGFLIGFIFYPAVKAKGDLEKGLERVWVENQDSHPEK